MSETSFAGIGRKRPQLNIPIELLDLDPQNPRLGTSKDVTQLDLIKILYEQFDVEELAFSMSENGYFDEEPIVVIPQNLPKKFKLSNDANEAQKQLETLIVKNQIRFYVVEGNRRTATLKLLSDKKIQGQVKVSKDFPKPTKSVLDDLKIIPAICYPDRSKISAYLGVRHIAGLLKWEAYAKAVFLANQIEKEVESGKDIEKAIQEVQRQTADRSDVIKRQYLYFKVLKEAEDDLSFDIQGIKDRFSLITVALNSPSIREFAGVPSHKKVDFSTRIVPVKKLPNLEKLLTWIYGNGKDMTPILTDSRKITSRLAPVLADKDAMEYLLKYGNLEDAYERSGGERTFLEKKIMDATKNLRNALSIAYKYKSDEVISLVEECIEAGKELQKMLRND